MKKQRFRIGQVIPGLGKIVSAYFEYAADEWRYKVARNNGYSWYYESEIP